jgi:hypothetical protein
LVPVPNSSGSSRGSHGGGFFPGGSFGYPDPYWGGSYYWGGHYYYWGGYYYLPDLDYFGHYRMGPDYGDPFANRNARDAMYYPPTPPPLGAPIPPKAPQQLEVLAPTELAAYVNESFYSPLATRLAAKDLTNKLSQRLAEYHSKKQELLKELRHRLDAMKDDDDDVDARQDALASLAREQTPRISELETAADQLRVDFLRAGLVGLFWGTGDWNSSRRWKLGEGGLYRPRESTLAFEFQVMRAAIFYQDGLSPAQRRLLREVAMDLQVQAFKPAAARETADDRALVYFFPETARVRFPDDLPEDLATLLSAFKKQKDELKQELRDAIYQLDSVSSSRRTQSLKRLAEKQAPQIAVLEQLAEEIRVGLARAGKTPGPASAPTFPPVLTARISAYKKEKNRLQKQLFEQLDTQRLKLEGADLRVKNGGPPTDPIAIQVFANGELPDRKLQSVRQAIADFNKENAERFAALSKQREIIRNDVAAFARSHAETVENNKSVDTLLKDFDEALKQQETWRYYEDYRSAVLKPGLTPEQRRLLFDGAVEQLGLPLPGGEY